MAIEQLFQTEKNYKNNGSDMLENLKIEIFFESQKIWFLGVYVRQGR